MDSQAATYIMSLGTWGGFYDKLFGSPRMPDSLGGPEHVQFSDSYYKHYIICCFAACSLLHISRSPEHIEQSCQLHLKPEGLFLSNIPVFTRFL